jgi:hypothetical protein
MPDNTAPICLLPGLGVCVRERCNFWDEAKEECTADCFDSMDLEAGSTSNPSGGCFIGFYEDFD